MNKQDRKKRLEKWNNVEEKKLNHKRVDKLKKRKKTGKRKKERR